MKFLEGRTVGIDLGTTYSAIAYMDDEGNPTLANNADGRPITPSVVLLDDDRVVVGPTFERISVASSEQIVEAIKREMGNSEYNVMYQNKRLTPEFISALIIKKMKQDAEKEIGPIAKVNIIQWAPGLPKTRSGKIMRRILRKVAANELDSLGDTSTLADPSVVEHLIENRLNK